MSYGKSLNSAFKKNIIRRFQAYHVDFINILKFGSKAPLKYQLLYCEPTQINLYTQYNSKNLPDHLSYIPSHLVKDRSIINRLQDQFVVGGDWDQEVVPIDYLLSYRQTMEKLNTGKTWREVGEFDRNVLKTIALTDIDKQDKMVLAEARFKRLDELIQIVEHTRTLKPQSELKKFSFREMGGIEVFIDRHGNFIQAHGGRHRLAIARFFKISAIPVCIVLVHEDCVKSGKFSELKSRSYELKKLQVSHKHKISGISRTP
jgi:hypothetical protein